MLGLRSTVDEKHMVIVMIWGRIPGYHVRDSRYLYVYKEKVSQAGGPPHQADLVRNHQGLREAKILCMAHL